METMGREVGTDHTAPYIKPSWRRHISSSALYPGRWKWCLLVTETWQIRGSPEEKPFVTMLEMTTVFSLQRRTQVSALCALWCVRVSLLSLCFLFLLYLCAILQDFVSTRYYVNTHLILAVTDGSHHQYSIWSQWQIMHLHFTNLAYPYPSVFAVFLHVCLSLMIISCFVFC